MPLNRTTRYASLAHARDRLRRRKFSPLTLFYLLSREDIVAFGKTKAVDVHGTTGGVLGGKGALGASRLLAAGSTVAPVPKVAARSASVVWARVGGIEQRPGGIVMDSACLDGGGEEEHKAQEKI